MIPGELKTVAGEIQLNSDRELITVKVANIGDRPVQVGSHYHFFEVNESLIFERDATLGYRLNIASGTAVRFEPGQERTVELVAYAGSETYSGSRKSDGQHQQIQRTYRKGVTYAEINFEASLRRNVWPYHW